jgi:hypothetical protein
VNHPHAHRHAIHCFHILGWNTRRWCRSCFHHWEDTCGELYSADYERLADANLVHAIFTELEDGDLPIPARILELDLSDLGVSPPPPSEPSAN